MLHDFKVFIARFNALDLAVAVIIGAAFGAIVTSLTGDEIVPVIGALLGRADLSNHFILLSVPLGYESLMSDYATLKEAGAAMIGSGAFVTAIMNLLILAFAIFLLLRTANRVIAKKEDAPAPAGPSEIDLLTEIRDELRQSA